MHPALSALVGVGELHPHEAGSARVRDLSRAHPVWRVILPDGRGLVVKGHARDRGLDLGIEFLVYRLAVWCAPLRAALPEALVVDEDRHLLVLADVGGASLAMRAGFPPVLAGQRPAPEPAWLAGAAATLGRTLGGVHKGTAGLPLPPARPPVALASLSGRSPLEGEAGRVGAALASDPVVGEAARQLVNPVLGCLVSHDMKWDNVVVRPDGRVALLDWELAGLGDPAVDLGFLLAEHLVRAEGRLTDAARGLLGGYAAEATPRTEVVGVLARRTSLAAGLRVGQLAVEVAHTHPDAVAPLTDLTRALLRGVDALAGEVAACLS